MELCREHQITGFPSIRVFRAGKSILILDHLSYTATNDAAPYLILLIGHCSPTWRSGMLRIQTQEHHWLHHAHISSLIACLNLTGALILQGMMRSMCME